MQDEEIKIVIKQIDYVEDSPNLAQKILTKTQNLEQNQIDDATRFQYEITKILNSVGISNPWLALAIALSLGLGLAVYTNPEVVDTEYLKEFMQFNGAF